MYFTLPECRGIPTKIQHFRNAAQLVSNICRRDAICAFFSQLLILNLPLIPYIARLISLPQRFLLPFILFFSLIGVYLVSFNTFDIYMMVGFATIAISLRFLEFPMAPMLIGFVLGNLLEDNLRRSLLISNGKLEFLWERPITLAIFSITIIILTFPLYRFIRSKLQTKNNL